MNASVPDSMGPLRPGTRLPGVSTYLRRHKVGCVARCHEEPILSPQLLGKAKVTDAQALGVSGLIHVQDVTGFEVPVDNLGAEGCGSVYANWQKVADSGKGPDPQRSGRY